MCYGVYPDSARVTWAPSKIFGDGKSLVSVWPQLSEFLLNIFRNHHHRLFLRDLHVPRDRGLP